MRLSSGTLLKGAKYDYVIWEVLGQGTFGITYKASVRLSAGLGSIHSDAVVAIKEFFMEDVNGRDGNTVTSGGKGTLFEKYRKKFAKEAENLSKLEHPNIVKVLECFEANNTVYYAMEYVPGGSLDKLIAEEGGMKIEECMPVLGQIGSALSYMHDNKMLHLDLKPANVMMAGKGKPVLIDFGLSKQYDDDGKPESTTSIGGGTPGYAPVEQINHHDGKGFPVTMDVYALGATLYKMITGARPADASDVLNDGLDTEPLRRAGLDGKQIECIVKAMAPLKKDRWQIVGDFLEALGCPMVAASDGDIVNDPSEDTVIEEIVPVVKPVVKPIEPVKPVKPVKPVEPVKPPKPVRKKEQQEEKKPGLRDRKGFQTSCKAVFAAAVAVILYSGYILFEFTYVYLNQSYPHALLLCAVLLMTLLGTIAVWMWKMNFRRSRLVKLLMSLMLLCPGLCSSFFLAFDYDYTEYVSEDTYKERSIFDHEGDMYTVQDDVIPFYKGRKTGLMNGSTGEIILPAEYEDAEGGYGIFLFDLAKTRKSSFSDEWFDDWAEYDKKGNTLVPLRRDGKSGVINVKGEVIVPLVYDSWYEIHWSYGWDSYKNDVIVGKDGKYGIISKQNDILLPLEYSGIKSDSYAPYPYLIAAKNGLWGVIDCKGNVRVPFKYEDINLSDNFSDDGLYAYKENGFWGVKSTSGKELLPCEYDIIHPFIIEYFVETGYWYVSKDEKDGVLDADGNIVIPFEYHRISPVYSGYDLFVVENRLGRCGVINDKNEIILPMEWNNIHISETEITAEKGGKSGKVKFNHSGERIN